MWERGFQAEGTACAKILSQNDQVEFHELKVKVMVLKGARGKSGII